MKKLLCLLILLQTLIVCRAEIITSDRRVVWEGNVGIVGGIPNTAAMAVHQNIPPGASAATINSALASCPSNRVVKLSAGTYTLNNDIRIINDGSVLKGAGKGQTLVTFGLSANEHLIFRKGSFSQAALSVDANLSVDATKGGTTLTLASVPSWVTIGERIGIDQINNNTFATNTGTDGGNSFRDTEGNGARGMGQIARVTNKDATTITVEIPLYYGWLTAQTAQIFEPYTDLAGGARSLRMAGVEDITFTYLGSGNDSDGIVLENAIECWVKGCAITNTYGGVSIRPYFCYRCEFRGNDIRDSHLYTGGQGYGISPWHVTSACLIEDNIINHLHVGLAANLGSAGNVFAYNYIGSGFSDPVNNQNPGLSTHSVHPHMNLFEGNWSVDKMLGDWTHGSSSHNTLFRNRIIGTNDPPPASVDGYTCCTIEYFNRYWNVVGNVFGHPGRQNKAITHSGSTAVGSGGSIYRLGCEVCINGDFTPADVYDYTSGMFLLLHRNYDTVTGGILDEPDVADTTLPISLYLPTRSTNLIVPFDPTTPGTSTNAMSATNIQAGHRFVFGTNFVNVSPFVVSATINANGSNVVVVFNEALTFGSGGSGGMFLTMSAGTTTMAYLSGSGSSSATFTTSRPIMSFEFGALNYTQPVNGWENAGGVDLPTFTGLQVINNASTTNSSPRNLRIRSN